MAALCAAAPLPSCSADCRGPGCESFYDEARLSVFEVPSDGDVSVWDVWGDEASSVTDGGADEGSAWSVDVALGAPVVGQPSATPDARVRWLAEEPVTWTGPSASEFGAAVWAEEVGEGFDLWVGAPGHRENAGAVYVFREAHASASEERAAAAASVVLTSDTANDRFGERLFPCADLTGDRVPEVAIVAPNFAPPVGWAPAGLEPVEVPPLAGAVFLVESEALALESGAVSVTDGVVARVWWGNTSGQGAGAAVVCDEDLDGDGQIDIVIGSPWAGLGVGRIDVLSGDPLPPSGSLDQESRWGVWTAPGGDAEWYGVSLATLREDGAPRLLVGSAGAGGGVGLVRLYSLAGRRLANLASFVPPEDREEPDHFGRWLATGPLDDDLLDDLVIGAPDFKATGKNAYDAGRLWVFAGADSAGWAGDVPTTEAEVEIAGALPFQRVGRGVALGDLGSDGRQDLLVPTRDRESGAP